MKFQASTVALALSLVLGATPALAAGKPPAKKSATVAKRVTPAKPVKSAKARPVHRKAAPVVAAKKPRVDTAKAAPAAKPAAPQTQTAKTTNKPAVTTANAKPAVPPTQTATFIPLGPERFYPNGIPELRPEFMHPLPDQATQAAQAARETTAMQQVSEDRRSWFAAPQ